MIEADAPRARPGLFARGLLLAAVVSGGCSGGDSGTVAAPQGAPEVVQAAPGKKGAPATRPPRGPDAAKALQDANSK